MTSVVTYVWPPSREAVGAREACTSSSNDDNVRDSPVIHLVEVAVRYPVVSIANPRF